MKRTHSPARARTLRKNLTDAERALWRQLRNRQFCGLKFRRQQPVGGYIVDFYCSEIKLVVELDGGQHVSDTRQLRHDDRRREFLEQAGYTILRFWNNEALSNTQGVLQVIADFATEAARASTGK